MFGFALRPWARQLHSGNFKSTLIVPVLLALGAGSVPAYNHVGPKWSSPGTTFYVETGTPRWNEAFEAAMGAWNNSSSFHFETVRGQSFDPCSPPGISPRNGVKFSNTNCNSGWGGTTLAVTLLWSSGGVVKQAGIVFNSNLNWDLYDTAWRNSVVDFKRVAIHELGHSLGLGHEESVPAIMKSHFNPGSTITLPQPDDINGVTALYGGSGGPPQPQPQPNLLPFRPQGWSDAVVVSKVTGTNLDASPITTSDSLYIDWAMANASGVAVATTFQVALFLNGTHRQTWSIDPPLAPNSGRAVLDYDLGRLPAGSHKLRLVVDAGSAVAESQEQDNEFERTIVVKTGGAGAGAPTAGAGADKTVKERERVSLLGWGTDPEGESLTFKWTQISGPAVALSDAETSLMSFTAPEVSKDTQLVFRLTVTDPGGKSGSDEVTVTVTDTNGGVNGTPLANAGPDQRVKGGKQVTLKGTGSDPDGHPIAYSWKQMTGPFVTISGSTQSAAVFTAPVVSKNTDLLFRLTVQDSLGASASDDVKVTVTKNNPPTVDAGSPQRVAAGQSVTLSGKASDPDGDSLTYQWTQISGVHVALRDRNKLSASFEAPVVERESRLVFKLTVDDGKDSIEKSTEVTIAGPAPELVFPYGLESGGPFFKGSFVGIAVANFAADRSEVRLTALNQAGKPSAEVDVSGPLPANGQKAFLTSEIEARGAASLLVHGDVSELEGFFAAGDGTRLDGVGGKLVEAATLYFPAARHWSAESTFLYLFNPGTQADPQVTLELFNERGLVVLSKTVSLPASGALAGSLEQIFGRSLDIKEGYIRVTGTQKLKGFEFLASGQHFSALGAQVMGEQERLLVPHFFLGPDGGTEIRLLNGGQLAATVVIGAFDDSGNRLAEAEVRIDPEGLLVRDLKQLPGMESLAARPGIVTGYLTLQVQETSVGVLRKRPPVIGSLTFTGNHRKFASSLPMLRRGLVETAFLQVAHSVAFGMYTGLAIQNPDRKTARIRLESFDREGRRTASKEFDLAPGRRVVGLLDDAAFFGPGFSQLEGHFRVISLPTSAAPQGVPVVSFALFGDYQGTHLAAVEGVERE